ncbi:MAG: transposase [Lentisphaerae bacterium]|nr:transposase [Lentisphaerota bacterium]
MGDLSNVSREAGVPGWHSRGYLPHYDSDVTTQHVTFHLADSLPREVVLRLEEELKAVPPGRQDVERRKRVEAWIDGGHGSCLLREPSIARMVESSLLFFDAQRYHLLAWVVMPNHVHVLFHPMNDWRVASIVASWKKFTARKICDCRKTGKANLEIGAPGSGVPGPVWHREYWDRYMRDERHFRQAMEYIHENPVKAGLIEKAEDWPWSSARFFIPGNANRSIGVPGSSP